MPRQSPVDLGCQFSIILYGRPGTGGVRFFLTARFSDWITKWLGEEKAAHITGPISEYFLFTLAALLTMLPVIALQFKRISLLSLLSNPLILPVQPAILQAGLVTTVAGFIHPLLGKFCALFTWPLLAYTNFIVTSLAKVKGAPHDPSPLGSNLDTLGCFACPVCVSLA